MSDEEVNFGIRGFSTPISAHCTCPYPQIVDASYKLFLRKHKQKSKSVLGHCYGLFILCASGHKTQNLHLWVMKTAGNNIKLQESWTKILMFTSITILILRFHNYFFHPNPLMITYLLINQPGPPCFAGSTFLVIRPSHLPNNGLKKVQTEDSSNPVYLRKMQHYNRVGGK